MYAQMNSSCFASRLKESWVLGISQKMARIAQACEPRVRSGVLGKRRLN